MHQKIFKFYVNLNYWYYNSYYDKYNIYIIFIIVIIIIIINWVSTVNNFLLKTIKYKIFRFSEHYSQID